MKFKGFLFAVASVTSFSSLAHAGYPMLESTTLPLTLDNINKIEAALKAVGKEKEFDTYLQVIGGLQFYPDATNPKTQSGLNDVTLKKAFYVTPILTPKSKGVVGGQEIATSALTVLDAADKLFDTLGFNINKQSQLTSKRDDLYGYANSLRTMISSTDGSVTADQKSQAEIQLKSTITEIENIDTKLENIVKEGGTAYVKISREFRTEVYNQITYKFATLGVTLSEEQTAFLYNGTYAEADGVVKELRANLANSQLGIKQLILRGGFDLDSLQAKVIGLYRKIRPDVSLGSLTSSAVYAKPATQTYLENSRSNKVIRPNIAYMIRGVNLGNDGKCGNTGGCNTVIEYTEAGARSALLAKTGVVIFPVTFEADVTTGIPDFTGNVSCDFKTGFKISGRADVKDGLVIYNGDVTNRISDYGINDGGCNIQTTGSKANASYHILDKIYKYYIEMHAVRGQDAYQARMKNMENINQEIAYQQNQSQKNKNNSSDWITEVVTWPAFPFHRIATRVISASRGFYWHTRIEDRESIDHVKFSTTISHTNDSKVERFSFDAFPIACWMPEDENATEISIGAPKVMKGCPSESLIPSKITTEAQNAVQNKALKCKSQDSVGECSEKIDTLPPSTPGGVTNPPVGDWMNANP